MSLDRFIEAQEKTYAGALAELKAGRKTGHWIWWIFPQLRGLGTTHNSIYYGITDEAEARAYIEHPILGARYRECVSVVHGHLCQAGVAPLTLMGGEIDVLKLRSSLELFHRHAFSVADQSVSGALPMMIERLLLEKLGWSRPKSDAPAVLGDFRPLDPLVIHDMLGAGHVLLAGVAGSGKSLMLNSQILPWMRSRGLQYIACDEGYLDPLPRSLVFDPAPHASAGIASLAAEALRSAVVLIRTDAGWWNGAEWNPILSGIIARVRDGKGPVKKWFLVVDVSTHVDQLEALWNFLPEAQAYGCTVIVTLQGAGRLSPESLRYFNVLAQFSAGISMDIDAVASSDVPSWKQTVLGLRCGQFILRIGSNPPRCYQIERTR
jgi:uncharacterized protein (DUF1810 family)